MARYFRRGAYNPAEVVAVPFIVNQQGFQVFLPYSHCVMSSIVPKDLADIVVEVGMVIPGIYLRPMRRLCYFLRVHWQIAKAQDMLVKMPDQMHFGGVNVTFPLHDSDPLCVTLLLPRDVKPLPF